jgi:hypothetical protein
MKNSLVMVSLAVLLVSVAGLAHAEQTAADFRKDPWLIYENRPSAMTVMWQADASADSTISWYSLTNFKGLQTAVVPENSGASDQHLYAATISGLAPNELVRYTVDLNGHLQSGTFKAAPSASDTALTLYALGDSQPNADQFNQVMGAVVADAAADPLHRQTLITHAGDFTTAGMYEIPWDLDYFNRGYSGTTTALASMPVMTAMGNHEGILLQSPGNGQPPQPAMASPQDFGSVLRKYYPYDEYASPGHSYYSFDYGPVHVAVLDQYTTSLDPGSAQNQWLNQDLAATNAPFRIIMFHEPAYSANGLNGSGEPDNLTTRQDVQPLIEKYGVQLVLQGHNHYYARADVNGVHYLTLGGAGAPASIPDPSYSPYLVTTSQGLHFAKLDINGDIMTVTTQSPTGTVLDRFTVAADQVAAPTPWR